MAEKFLNTRIALKIDTLENWQNSTIGLKKGELAIATIAASAGTGLTEPVTMIKIGEDGVKTFKDLEWNLYAKASDVLSACKSEASLKTFVNGVIADAGIASSDAMEALAGRVTTVEGKVTTLEGEMDAVEAKAAANESAIDALEGLVGDKKVATQISEAIAALDLANTYEAKGEAAKVQTALDTYKTSNDAAVQKNATDIAGEITRAKAAEEANASAISAIKDGTTIDSFADVETALAGKETAGAAAQALTDAKAYADGLADNYDAKGSAAAAQSAAETYAKNYADGLAGNYDAAGSAAAAETASKGYTDSELERLVGDETVGTQISTAITELDLANTYAAKSHKHVKADITDFAHTHEISEVNGLQDALDGKQAVGDYATKTEAQGYATTAKTEALEAVAQGYATKKEASDAQSAAEAAQSAADSANAKIDAFMSDDATVEGAIDTLVEINKYITDDTAAFTQLSAKVDKLADGTTPVKEAEHADKADVASSLDDAGITQVQAIKVNSAGVADKASGLNADGEAAVKAVKVDNAAHADAADSATKATQDGAGNVITTTYETKADATQKYNDAVSYADSLAKNYATAAQGAKADSAVQSVTFAGTALTKEGGAVSISKADAQTALGLGSAAYTNTDAYATSAQGLLADSAVQQITTTENNGLKVTGKNQIDIDTDVVFVFNCGSSTTVV